MEIEMLAGTASRTSVKRCRTAPARMPRNGRLWNENEDAVVRETYPDYARMRRRLPQRSLAALKNRGATLGVVRHRHVWTNLEIRKLTSLVLADTSNVDLQRAFPYLRLRQITEKARHLRLPRRKPQLVGFDDLALSEVRKRAVAMGLSLRELDKSAGTGSYFQKSTRKLVLEHVARAACVLGGDIRFEWEEA
jgi:hypothetical protein